MQHGSKQLAGWIDRMGLNQREAARKLGMDFTTLNKLLKAKRFPGRQNAIAIRNLTGIPVDAWEPTLVGDSRKRAPRKAPKSQHWQSANV